MIVVTRVTLSNCLHPFPVLPFSVVHTTFFNLRAWPRQTRTSTWFLPISPIQTNPVSVQNLNFLTFPFLVQHPQVPARIWAHFLYAKIWNIPRPHPAKRLNPSLQLKASQIQRTVWSFHEILFSDSLLCLPIIQWRLLSAADGVNLLRGLTCQGYEAVFRYNSLWDWEKTGLDGMKAQRKVWNKCAAECSAFSYKGRQTPSSSPWFKASIPFKHCTSKSITTAKMLLKLISSISLLASLTTAHFDIEYPEMRGDSFAPGASQWIYPC